ncbi:YciI family protein [Niveibacterium sp. SC-1]|uniref:YciI family protein n=1 Tax=Niveibacterium sp. SC-1 TaxID=3135646 RepID=UPI00311F9C27
MKFMCMVYLSEAELFKLTPEELKKLDIDSLAHDRGLAASGHYVTSQALQSVKTARCVRHQGKGEYLVTDGPFVETKEQFGGFILVEAKDQDEALALCMKIPVARFGGVEVRPIYEMQG